MHWNILEIAQNGFYLKLYRGFVLVMQNDQEQGRVVLEELNSLILSAEQATLSKQLMVRLAELGIPIITCGRNYHPIAITQPYANHHHTNKVLQLQINAFMPLKKRLWQQIIKTKIQHQRQVLERINPNSTAIANLQRLSSQVRSGDPDNFEAQAARAYWQELMGKGFRRKPQAEDNLNSALNYGYTVLRAACARAIAGAGLNPSLGLHHHNLNNPFCLADDLMELFRPIVDLAIDSLELSDGITPTIKASLAKLLQADIRQNNETTTVNTAIQNLAFSLVNSFESKQVDLQIPELVI